METAIAVTERGKTMSISKYAYNPDVCDGKPCPGDCDFCRLWLDRVDEGAEQVESFPDFLNALEQNEAEYAEEFEEERQGYK